MEVNSLSPYLRRLAVLGYSAYLLLGWCSVLVPALINEIESTFHRSDTDIGIIYFLGALLYGVGALGGGFLSERLGSWGVLLFAVGLLAASLIGQGLLGVWILFAGIVAFGKLANGAIDAGVGAVFLDAFAAERGAALSLLHLFYGIGALLGPAAVGLTIAAGLSWRLVFAVSAIAVIMLGLAIARLPHGKAAPPPAEVVGPAVSPEVVDASEAGVVPAGERSLRPFVLLAIAMALYEAQIVAFTGWLVRFLRDDGVGIATGALSAFWVGVCASRLAGPWIARRIPNHILGPAVLGLCTVTLAGALLTPWTAVTVGLLLIAGFLAGPTYPLLVAIGGDLYPHRLERLSGGMTAAATIGALSYPPLVGVIAETWSVRAGLFGAAALGIPAVVALIIATHRHDIIA